MRAYKGRSATVEKIILSLENCGYQTKVEKFYKKNLFQPKIHKEYGQAENLKEITLEVTGQLQQKQEFLLQK